MPEEQADLLGNAFFPATAPPSQLHTDFDPPPNTTRAWPEFTTHELGLALRTTLNTSAPGFSGIGYRVIKWMLKDSVTHERLLQLYNTSLSLGHVPSPWKKAVVVPIPKPRKTDMSNPRSYRPISLLECLSKLMEKMVATRMQHDAVLHQLIPDTQFGGIITRGTNDAGIQLVHDVQTAFARKETLAVVAFDIKGFFDYVDHARMAYTLEIQGYPPQLVKWVLAFLTDRSYVMSIAGHASDTRQFPGRSVPQGSPLSPILSASYTAPCFTPPPRGLGLSSQFFVDDGIAKCAHKDEGVAVRRAAAEFVRMEGRMNQIRLQADRGDKLELIVFQKKPLKSPPFNKVLEIEHPDGTKSRVHPRREWRYVGFYFTPRLDWRVHVTRMANKAKATCSALRMISNCVRGLSIANARTIYNSVVMPVLTYGTPVWYTGVRQKGLVKILQTAQNLGVRWVMGAFKTSPLDELHHLASIPPVEYVTHSHARAGAPVFVSNP
jgi:hypothetical protein